MGTCTMVRMLRGGKGRGSRGYFPVQMVQPSQRLLTPATSIQPSFFPTTREQHTTCSPIFPSDLHVWMFDITSVWCAG